MDEAEFARLHAKLRNSPPYDWEEDVEMLLTELDRYHKELSFIQEKHRDLLQKWPQFHQLDVAGDALMHIQDKAAALGVHEIEQMARRARLTIQGER